MSFSQRLLTIAGAYIAASLVAGAILAMALVYTPNRELEPIDLDLLQITALFVSMVSGFVAILALIPTLIVGIYAERTAIRSPLFYALAGAAIGLGALALYAAGVMWNGLPADRFSFGEAEVSVTAIIASVVFVVAIAGLAGGLTYWAIAGRKAGDRRVVSIAS